MTAGDLNGFSSPVHMKHPQSYVAKVTLGGLSGRGTGLTNPFVGRGEIYHGIFNRVDGGI